MPRPIFPFAFRDRRPALLVVVLLALGLVGWLSLSDFGHTAAPSPAAAARSDTNAIPLITPVPMATAAPLSGGHGGSARTAPDPNAVVLAQRLQAAMAAMGQGASGPAPALLPVPTNGHPNPSLVPAPAKFSEKQLAALSDLRWRSGKQLEVRGNSDNNTIRYLEGLSLERPAETAAPGQSLAATTAGNFLERNRELLLLKSPAEELAQTQETTDTLGYTQIRYEQRYEGLSVWPAGLSVQMDRAGHANLLTGAYVPTPEGLATTPQVDATRAAELARQNIGATPQAPIERQELIVYAPIDGTTRLAYKIEMHASFIDHRLVIVDATTGEIVKSLNQTCSAGAVGRGLDEGGTTRSVNIWSEGGQHYLVDTSKPMFNAAQSDPPSPGTTFGGIIILDAKNVNPQVNPQTYAPQVISSTSTNSGFPAFGISASFNLSIVYEYYQARHQRNSIDGKGGTIRAVVNIPFDNGYWSQGSIQLGNVDHYADSLDFVAHEMTHGVTESTANLIYENQSGAMNEAFSDVLGESTEAFHRGQPDWLWASQLNPVRQTRSFKNPSSKEIRSGRPYPAKMSQFITANDPVLDGFTGRDNGGVHFNSSIINFAYYQLAEGLPGAVGLAKAERIFYRALTTKLQRQSQFIDGRLACVQSAVEIFGAGSPEAIRTGEAFNVVEIFDQAPPQAPTPIGGVTGADSLLFTYVDQSNGFTYLARREAALGDPASGIVLSPGVPMAPSRRPAVRPDGSQALVVTLNNDMALVNTQTGAGQPFNLIGQVWSVGLSPDGLFAAVILRDVQTGQPKNQINVFRIGTQQVETYDLLAPTLDGGSLATVLYGDTLAFSLDGGRLYYDALNRLRFSDGTVFDNWSLYVIDRTTGREFEVVKPFAGVNIGNPSLGKIHNNRLVFEAQNLTTSQTTIYGLNTQSGQSGALFTVSSARGVSYPNLNGDDTKLYFSDNSFTGNGFLQSIIGTIGVTADGLSFSGTASPTLNGGAPAPLVAAVYRRGTFSGVPSVQVAATAATAMEGVASTGTFTLTRTGSTVAALPVQFVLTGTAGNGTDYFGTSLSATIAAGSATTTVTIAPLNDSLVEGDETVILTLATASHYTIGAAGSATITIKDDDQAGNAFQTWALANNVVGEGGNEDGDPYLNLMEFALGTNPKSVNPAGLIKGELRTLGEQKYLALVVSRQTNNPAVQYVVEVAGSATGPWNSGIDYTTTLESTQTKLVVRDNVAPAPGQGRYMRLKIVLP
jgi:Zn-dependent metalloprotease